MKTPGPWEARAGRANTTVYQEGTAHAVALGCSQADAEFIAAMPRLLGLIERVVGYAEDCANDREERPSCLRDLRRELRRLPQ